MAGGTGSGLGSYTMRLLRDEYPKISQTAFMVAPQLGGEVIL